MFRKTTAFSLLFAFAAAVQCAAPQAADQGPGYGKVQSITRLPAQPAEPSASTGASAPSKARAQTYLMRIRMDDGRIQVRQVRKREVAVGQRVLVTNAGEVLPE
jgi:hypothetical protein